jgi:sodium pump decarboxylase gamma subunit
MTINWATVEQGLYVMVVGMAIVFAALILVMLAMIVLERVFRVKPEAEESAPVEEMSSKAMEAPSSETAAQGIAAAVSVALALRLQEQEKAPAPAPVRVMSIKDEPSLWAAIGKLG